MKTADEIRLNAFNIKKRQLNELGVDTLVTACANCRIQLEDGLEENEMDMPVLGLTEMLAELLPEPVNVDEEKAVSMTDVLVSVNSDAELKQALAGLDAVQRRHVNAQFVKNVTSSD